MSPKNLADHYKVHLKKGNFFQMFAVPEGEKAQRGGRGQDCQRKSLSRTSPHPRVQDPNSNNHDFVKKM